MSDTITAPVRRNYNSRVVCVFSRGPRITHYLGLNNTELCVLQMPNTEFDEEFDRVLPQTPIEFAQRHVGTASARKMIPQSGAAKRVLAGILRGQPQEAVNQLEIHMTEATATFRRPDGPVAQIHLFLDKKLDAIKAGKVSRKELIDALAAKDFSLGTITTQCGVWAKNNGVTFTRPAQAAVNKKAAAKKARAKKTDAN